MQSSGEWWMLPSCPAVCSQHHPLSQKVLPDTCVLWKPWDQDRHRDKEVPTSFRVLSSPEGSDLYTLMGSDLTCELYVSTHLSVLAAHWPTTSPQVITLKQEKQKKCIWGNREHKVTFLGGHKVPNCMGPICHGECAWAGEEMKELAQDAYPVSPPPQS